jgi:hypothetical protein
MFLVLDDHCHAGSRVDPRDGKGKKGKALPVTGRGGPYGCERLRLPHFLDIWLTDGGKVVSALRAGRPLPPQEDS